VLTGCGDGAASDVGEAGHAEVGGGASPGEIIELGEFLPGGGEADLQTLGFAGPAFMVGFVDAGLEVVAQVGQPRSLGRVGPQERAPDVPLTELTDARIGYRYGSAGCDRGASSALSESWSSLRVAA
jgi:hypothetical protein